MLFRPPEWQKNKTIWLAWPYDQALWQENLAKAQREFIALTQVLASERLVLLFPHQAELQAHRVRFVPGAHHRFACLNYADIWIRDTFPIAVLGPNEAPELVQPSFNGWGNKYLFEADRDLSERAAKLLGWPALKSALVFEGGAIECDGAGTLLTTEQCLLNDNRNKGWDKSTIEQEFARLFGTQKVIWLKEGLKFDHTDGHIDTIARFIGPATVAIMVPKEKSDPNYDVLMAIKAQLAAETDAQGRKLKLLELPSCGAVYSSEGQLMPASFLNFVIGDHTLAVPTYGTPFDDEAVDVVAGYAACAVQGSSAKAILSGGGAFHCMSQEYYYPEHSR